MRLDLTVGLASLVVMPAVAGAWGNQGHDIIALVAYDRLSPDLQQKVNAILGDIALMDAATFADRVRPVRKQTSNWHFVDIPLAESAYDESRDCQLDPDKGDCAVKAIARCEDAVQNGSDGCGRSQTESLEFLIHFVGDVHQPLHCEDDADRGGNEKPVCFFGACSKNELHRVWDTEILVKREGDDQAWIQKIESHLNGLADADIQEMAHGTVVDWVNESHRLAQKPAYALLPKPDGDGVYHLGLSYYNAGALVVQQQLERAAVRLSSVLTTVVGDAH